MKCERFLASLLPLVMRLDDARRRYLDKVTAERAATAERAEIEAVGRQILRADDSYNQVARNFTAADAGSRLLAHKADLLIQALYAIGALFALSIRADFIPGHIQVNKEEVDEWVKFCVEAVEKGGRHPKWTRDYGVVVEDKEATLDGEDIGPDSAIT